MNLKPFSSTFRKLRFLALLLVMLAFNLRGFSQITLDAVYPNGSLKLYMVNLELSGMKYLVKSDDSGNRYLKFYNLDHSFWKMIGCNPFPAFSGWPYYDALYISETLFDCDSAVEFLYCTMYGNQWFSAIYKENGNPLLVCDSCAPLVKINVPQQYRPIYNTPVGTKLILSHMDGSASVYDLPCTLSTGIDQLSGLPGDAVNLNVYPNPSFYETTIEYNLPQDRAEGEIILTDSRGREVKRYSVDKTFSTLLIDQRDLAPGSYYYSLESNNKVLISKKIVILK